MAGHSKWANIRHKKAKEDAKRAKVFTKHIREITVASRVGGGDPAGNPRLALAIDNAKTVNLPKDNIERAIKKGTGELDDGSSQYEEATYEGYGPGGIAYFIEVTTNNYNRTVGDIRHIFAKFGGNLGTDGSVAYLFEEKGIIQLKASGQDDEELMLLAIDAGADDVIKEEDLFIITTLRENLFDIRKSLENSGLEIESAELNRIPLTEVKVDADTAKSNFRMIDMFEENDDVSDVYTNMQMDDETLSVVESL